MTCMNKFLNWTDYTESSQWTEGGRLCYMNQMGPIITELTAKPATARMYQSVRCECSGLKRSDQTTTGIPKKRWDEMILKMQIKTECNRLQMNCVYWQFYKVFLSPCMNMLSTVMLWTSVYLVLPCWCCSRNAYRKNCNTRKWQNPHFEQAVWGWVLFTCYFLLIYNVLSLSSYD